MIVCHFYCAKSATTKTRENYFFSLFSPSWTEIKKSTTKLHCSTTTTSQHSTFCPNLFQFRALFSLPNSQFYSLLSNDRLVCWLNELEREKRVTFIISTQRAWPKFCIIFSFLNQREIDLKISWFLLLLTNKFSSTQQTAKLNFSPPCFCPRRLLQVLSFFLLIHQFDANAKVACIHSIKPTLFPNFAPKSYTRTNKSIRC